MAQTVPHLAVVTDHVPLKWRSLAHRIAWHCGNNIRASMRLALVTRKRHKLCRNTEELFAVLHTVSTIKQSQRIFSIILLRSGQMKYLLNWRTYSPVHSQHNCKLHYQRSLCNTLTCDVIMSSSRTETETVSRMQKAGPFDCCCSHQSVASPSLCLCHGSRWTFCGVFMVQCVTLILTKFLYLWYLSFDCFVYRQNVTCVKQTFYRVFNNHSQIRNCFWNRAFSCGAFSCGWMTLC